MKLLFKLIKRMETKEIDTFSEYDTINFVKEYIIENFNIPEPILIHKGSMLLNNDRTIKDYLIEELDTIYVVKKIIEEPVSSNSNNIITQDSLSEFTNILNSMINTTYSYQPFPGLSSQSIESSDNNETEEMFPNETHIPENNYSEQLETLQTMGFIDNVQNIQILNMTNGDVNQAMEYLL